MTIKTTSWLLAFALASATLLPAQDKMGKMDDKKDKMEDGQSKKMKKKKMDGKKPMEEKKGKM